MNVHRLRRAASCYLAAICISLTATSSLHAKETLIEFGGRSDTFGLEPTDTTTSVVDREGRKALRIDVGSSGDWPGVWFKPKSQYWDLSAYGYVEATITNASNRDLRPSFRIDCKPNGSSGEPWNGEVIALKKGETGTLRVWFGRSWGHKGYPLDAKKITGMLICQDKSGHNSSLLIDNIIAGGPPGGWGNVMPKDGVMIDFAEGFEFEEQVDLFGSRAKLVDDRRHKVLEVSFEAGDDDSAVYLKPQAVGWNLQDYTQVEVDVTNTGGSALDLLCRVGNRGAKEQQEASSTRTVLRPRRKTTIKIEFTREDPGRGLLDSDNIKGVFIAPSNKGTSGTIHLSAVRAVAETVTLPSWLGTRPPVAGDWTRTLNEEFDGPALDTKMWTPRLCWDGPHEWAKQRYSQDNVYVEDGKMVIKCEKRRGHQYNDSKLPVREYSTGAVTSLDKWTQKYGYLEARIKLPRAIGLWPAFWLMPDRGPGNGSIWDRRSTHNGGMEIDIFEHLTKWGPYRTNIAAHWDGYDKEHKSWGDARQYYKPTKDGYHYAGCLWEPGKLTWYIDGTEMISYENARVASVPLFFKFTVEMGGWGGDTVEDDRLPDYFRIDHVRAWQLKERM